MDRVGRGHLGKLTRLIRYQARLSRLEPKDREKVEDGTLRLRALEDCQPPDRLTPFEQYVYGLYQRLSPWRGASFDGLGPIDYAAVQRVLDIEQLSGYRRERVETVVSRLDAAFRAEAHKASKERMNSQRKRGRRG